MNVNVDGVTDDKEGPRAEYKTRCIKESKITIPSAQTKKYILTMTYNF